MTPVGSVFANRLVRPEIMSQFQPKIVHDKTLGRIFKISQKNDQWVKVDFKSIRPGTVNTKFASQRILCEGQARRQYLQEREVILKYILRLKHSSQ